MGVFVQVWVGVQDARKEVFSPWIIWTGGKPLGGGGKGQLQTFFSVYL